MKNTLQTVLTISNTDIVTMLVVKQKEELILKVPILRQQKIDLLSKYVAILEANLQKRWDENNSKDAILSAAKTVVSLYNPGIEFTILADNTMLEAATRRVHNTFGNRLNYSGNNLPSYKNSFSVGPLPMLSTEWVHEKDERSFNAFMFASFSLVEKNKESEKLISLEKEDNIKLVEIDVEITKIDSFLKDDKKLHDHIVAQMTERAIENNQEMKVLLSGIKLLS